MLEKPLRLVTNTSMKWAYHSSGAAEKGTKKFIGLETELTGYFFCESLTAFELLLCHCNGGISNH